MLTDEQQIYQENILDHYKNPRNHGKLSGNPIRLLGHNPLCGDKIELYLKLENNKVKEVKFEGKGCALSIASTSMLSEIIKGKSLSEIKKINEQDVKKMLGIRIGLVRTKCALLSLKTLQKGINKETKK